MDVTQLPFNRLIGLELSNPDCGFLVSLPEGTQYTNHLGTVHASALLAVVEAASGEFLLRHMGRMAGFVPVVRRLECKFRQPAFGRVSARSMALPEDVAQWRAELTRRGRVLVTVPIEVVDEAGAAILSATVEWFITRSAESEEVSERRIRSE